MQIVIHFYRHSYNKWKVWGYMPKTKQSSEMIKNGYKYKVGFAFGIGLIRIDY